MRTEKILLRGEAVTEKSSSLCNHCMQFVPNMHSPKSKILWLAKSKSILKSKSHAVSVQKWFLLHGRQKSVIASIPLYIICNALSLWREGAMWKTTVYIRGQYWKGSQGSSLTYNRGQWWVFSWLANWMLEQVLETPWYQRPQLRDISRPYQAGTPGNSVIERLGISQMLLFIPVYENNRFWEAQDMGSHHYTYLLFK